MFKLTAQTLLISVVALNACYAMEDEKPNEKKGGFFKTIKDKVTKNKKKKKKTTNVNTEIKPNNTNVNTEIKRNNTNETAYSASDCTMEDSEASLTEFYSQFATPIRNIVQNTDKAVIITLNEHTLDVKKQLAHKYLCMKETLAKELPPELTNAIFNLAYNSAKSEPEYAFPRENAVMDMVSYLSKTNEVEVMGWDGIHRRGDMRWYLFKVGGMTIQPVNYDSSRKFPPAQGVSLNQRSINNLGATLSHSDFLGSHIHFYYNEQDAYNHETKVDHSKEPFAFLITGFDDLEGNPIDLSNVSVVLKPLEKDDQLTIKKGRFVQAKTDNFVFKIERK